VIALRNCPFCGSEVDMTKDTPLVQWAKSERVVKSKKQSNLKKMQKSSKRKNR
jgi:endogenous inhibitor of DNA gyrase (YacG/DUF329 family)